MSKCVRDADQLSSLKPHYTENDISNEIEVKKGAVNLQCTRFKTRIRMSDTQVRFIFRVLLRIVSDRCGLAMIFLVDYSISNLRRTKAKSMGR